MIPLTIYFGALAASTVLSFAPLSRIRLRIARIAAIVLAIPLGLSLIVLGVFTILVFVNTPPTLDRIQKHFPAQQHDLQTIVDMSNEDSRFTRIDPTFLDRTAPDGTFQGRYMAGDPKAELPKERWDQYRALFTRNHINQGIERDKSGDAFIRFGAQGLLDRGFATGIVYCANTATLSKPDVDRYEPCLSGKASGSNYETENPHKEAFSFRRLNGRWYAYSQGPG